MSYEEFTKHQMKKAEFEKEMLSHRAEYGDEAHFTWLYDQLFETEITMEKLNERLAKEERFRSTINRASSNFHMCDFNDVRF